MIFTRYLARQIIKSTSMVLLILVCLSLFFDMVQKLDQVGRGGFGSWEFIQYLLFKIPLLAVDFMPLATLLGCILSMGNLASGSEIIAFQSAGLSLKKLISSVSQVGVLLAVVTFLVANLVAPKSEMYSKELKSLSDSTQVVMQNRQGVWIKDESNIVFVGQLFPDGNAKNIEIYHLDAAGQLKLATSAQQALMQSDGWELHQVEQSSFAENKISVMQKEKLRYEGFLSEQLLESLVVTAELMPVNDLYGYIHFLDENELSHNAESLTFWQKVYTPLTIVVMCLLAIPFVIGSQRDSNTGQRLIIGILLGLVFFILNRLLIQLGEQVQLLPAINALLPTLAFVLLTSYLIRRKVS